MKKLFWIIALVLFLIVLFTYYSINSIWSTVIKPWKYLIDKWDTIATVPMRLWLKINSTEYKIWLKLNSTKTNIKAWTFSIKEEMSLVDFLNNKSNKPDTLDKEITILPGWNIFDIDQMLVYKSIINPWELIGLSKNLPADLLNEYAFLKGHTLEWFIYPDTYRIALDSKLIDIVKIALEEFNTKIYVNYKSKDFYNNLIMWSIVEREEKNVDNKPIVAWILEKRLDEWISIWADATVCYQYELTQKECTPAFIWEHIYIKSKYNTRDKLWLPPTPISNMTSDTFDAVMNPKKSDYYYYLHDMKWQIHFASTLKGHNSNKNLYLK